MDNATWQALGLTLTLLGLVVSVLMWRRRGVATGLRALAWSLLPLAAAMTGTLRLGWEIADAAVSWAVRLVFSPIVWGGVILAGLSMVLFVVSGLVRRRSTPAVEKQRSPGKAIAPQAGQPAVADEDMADIEAILKKHGIG